MKAKVKSHAFQLGFFDFFSFAGCNSGQNGMVFLQDFVGFLNTQVFTLVFPVVEYVSAKVGAEFLVGTPKNGFITI